MEFVALLGLLGAIAFFVMSIISLIKKRKTVKRNILIALGCFFLFIAGVVSSSEVKVEETKGVVTEQLQEVEKQENRPIDIKLKEDNTNVDIAILSDGNLTLQKEVRVMWDETSILKHDVYNLFEVLGDGFEDGGVETINVILTTKMVDSKGNESIEEVVKYEYSRDTFEKLNYEKFLDMSTSQTWRILNESDSYWIHPGIYKNVKEDYKNKLLNGIQK